MAPSPEPEPEQAPPTASAWLRELTRQAGSGRRATVIAGSAAGLLTILQMGLLAAIVSEVVVHEAALAEVASLVTALFLVVLLRFVAQGLQGQFSARASSQARARVREAMLASWHRQGPVRLAGTSAATLSREWLEHVDALHGYLARYLPQMQLCVFVPAMVLAVVIWLDWLAAIFLILSAPLIPLFMALVGMGAEALNQQHFLTAGRLSGQFLDRLRGLTTLQIFGQTEAAAIDLTRRSDQYRQITMKTLRLAFLSSAVLEFFSSVAIAVVAMYVGFGLLGYISFGPAGQLTLFSGLFVLLLAPEFFQPLRQLAQHYHDRAAALGAAEEIIKRLTQVTEQEETPEAPSTHSPSKGGGAVVCRGASYRYANGRTALAPVDVRVGAGETLAITGPSGAGKSTLLALLAGFITPTSGEVLIHGNPPGQAPVAWLAQQPFLVQGSWADNLRLTAPEATELQMHEALASAGLGELLQARGDQLGSLVSETGAGLSGGQARRLGLARVFLSDAPLVLLDEPTAGLDNHSEQRVLEGLRSLRASGRTLVMVTHHQALAETADQTLQLKTAGSPPEAAHE